MEYSWRAAPNHLYDFNHARPDTRGHRCSNQDTPQTRPGTSRICYEACLAHELQILGMRVERQKPVPLFYDGVKLDCGFRADMVVNGILVAELKCKEVVHPVDKAQLLSHMRLLDLPLCLLINFHVVLLKDGIKRFVNNYVEPLEELASKIAKDERECHS